jgi:hypothetical protein
MRRVLLVGLVLTIIALLIIVGLTVSIGPTNAVVWDGKYQVGDYAEYYCNNSRLGNSIECFNVTSVNETVVVCNMSGSTDYSVSRTFYAYPGFVNFSDTNPFGMGREVRGPILMPNATVTYLGKVDVDTKWGLRSCDHYNITTPELMVDELFYHGVVVKCYMEYISGGLKFSNELKNTNLKEIVNP